MPLLAASIGFRLKHVEHERLNAELDVGCFLVRLRPIGIEANPHSLGVCEIRVVGTIWIHGAWSPGGYRTV